MNPGRRPCPRSGCRFQAEIASSSAHVIRQPWIVRNHQNLQAPGQASLPISMECNAMYSQRVAAKPYTSHQSGSNLTCQHVANKSVSYALLSNLPGMVVFTNAIACPSTMVIEALDTSHAHMAVLCSQLLPCMTVFTPSTCKPH